MISTDRHEHVKAFIFCHMFEQWPKLVIEKDPDEWWIYKNASTQTLVDDWGLSEEVDDKVIHVRFHKNEPEVKTRNKESQLLIFSLRVWLAEQKQASV